MRHASLTASAPDGFDSSTVQTLQNYGEYVYDGGSIGHDDRIHTVPAGMANVAAPLRSAAAGHRNCWAAKALRALHRDVVDWLQEVCDE